MKYAQGISVLGISKNHLSLIKIFLPSLQEQTKIANFLSDIYLKIEKLTRKKELMAQYKKGMMQKLFSREIRFKDENGNDYPPLAGEEVGGGRIFFKR